MNNIINDFPFQSVLSFDPLLAYINKQAKNLDKTMDYHEKGLKSLLREAQDLQGPIKDANLLKDHADLVDRLMSTVFSPLSWDTDTVGAVTPFSIEPFFASPRFRRLFLDERGFLKGRISVGEELFDRGRVIRAYLFILEQFYGIRQRFDYPVIRIIKDPETGLDRHFKIELDYRFAEIHARKAPKALSDEERNWIQEHLTEPEVLRELLPPEDFELRGFTVLRAMDITESEMISALQRDLIDQDSIVSKSGFLTIQQNIRTLFRRSDLVATLAALQDDQVLLLNSGCDMVHSCIFADSHHVPASQFKGSAFEKAVQSREIVRISDMSKDISSGNLEKDIVNKGIRSCLIAPLIYKDECIGTLDLGTPRPGELGPMDALLMEQIIPIFSIAIKKALDDLHSQVQKVIKENCTAIHPSVEWRFRKAAIRYLENLRKDPALEIEPIAFKNVYPLYGSSDIRGSSDERNRAIQKDLAKHLQMGFDVIRSASEAHSLPILEELKGRIGTYIEKIQRGLETSDELSMVKFLRDEVESLFPQLKGFGLKAARAVELYQTTVDREMGTVYRLRRDFEESFSLLSQKLATYLDRKEAEAQAIFPHYFERHETDGVDYLMYLGASLTEDGKFHELYLRNLRLWQLKVACGMARRTEKLKSSLNVPLDIGQLILVQNTPLSIRFRFDEKRFSVDGAYDIRHAIIKSRVDKAVVRRTGERLTQPGKIAVIYSNSDEAEEIGHHIHFLQSKGYLTEELEKLEVEDLPGVQGLRSFRVGVNLESKVDIESVKIAS